MKRILIFVLALSFILAGCGSNNDLPLKTIEPLKSENLTTKNPDIINESTYAGKLTELTETTLTILMGEKDSETFTLNERAKRDIEILKINVNDRIIVEFDPDANRNILSVQKIRSEI